MLKYGQTSNGLAGIPSQDADSPSLDIHSLDTLGERELWVLFQTQPNQQDRIKIRNELHKRYRHLALNAATQYCRYNMPYSPILEEGDILSYAELGLLDAIDSYRLDRGTTFKTWSHTRIRGAIIDGLRVMQDFSRVISLFRRKIKPLQERLSHELSRKVSIEEVIERFPNFCIGKKWKLSDFKGNALLDVNVFNQKSDNKEGQSEEGMEEEFKPVGVSRSESLNVGNPTQGTSRVELIQKVLLVLKDPQERQVIFLYFFSGMTYPKIAKVTGLSNTLISLKRISALEHLRQEAKDNQDFLELLRN